MKLMTHIVAGYPTMKECEKIALTMAESGVSYIEIQFPFSDPIADGPTIMEANSKALSNGITTEECFDLVTRLCAKIDTPLLAMTYYNIAFRYGLEKFCRKAREAGMYGLIIPDIPVDEEKYDHYLKICKKYSLHPIQVISPITPDERLKKIARVASGFVYCVSNFGTTGERGKLNSDLRGYMSRVKKFIKTPLALGFGISNGEQAATASKYADIVVIGSKIINVYREKDIKEVKDFLKKISPNITIRKIKKSDNKYLSEIIHKSRSEFGEIARKNSLKDFESKKMYETYNNDHSAYFVALKDEEILGGAGIAPLRGEKGAICELQRMYLSSKARGMGIGKMLLDHCIEAAKKNRYKKCYLETLRNMPAARSLYERNGFKRLNKPLGNTGHAHNDIWYVKDL